MLVVASAMAVYASGQSTLVPIVEMNSGGLMGGVLNGRWYAPDPAVKFMGTKIEFVLVGEKGIEEGGVSLGELQIPEERCEDFYPVEFESKMNSGVAIGTNAKWNFMPRKPKEISTQDATYKTIVANFLKAKGISKPTVEITRALRIDLDGDGREEVVISAMHYNEGLSPSAEKGDYSLVLLRKLTGKTVTTHLLAGDFYTKPVEFGAPSRYGISAVADLNGDG